MTTPSLRFALATMTALALLAPLPLVAGQAPGEGALFFTDEVLTRPANDLGTRVLGMTDAAPTEEASKKAYLATGLFALTYTTQFDYEVTEDFALEGTVKATVFVSCDAPAPYRPGQEGAAAGARLILMKDGDAISQQDMFGVPSPCTGSSTIREFNFEVDSAGTEFEAGDVLNVQFLLWVLNPPQAAGSTVYALVGSTTHPSGITAVGLPSAGEGSELVEETLVGETALVSHSFDNATTASYIYNWTTDLAQAQIAGNASVTNGSAQLTVRDANGTELLNTTIGPDGWNETLDVDAAAGNWTILADYSDFVGSVSLAIGPVPAPALTPADEGPAGNETSGNETDDAGPAEEEGAGIPGPGLAAVLVVSLAAAAYLRRRR